MDESRDGGDDYEHDRGDLIEIKTKRIVQKPYVEPISP
jgi:hypothetical protein